MIWLSVIVPVHNGAHFLDATLASAAAECDDGVEFLIYDSSDDDGACQRIAGHYAATLKLHYHRAHDCKPWTAKTNRGVAEAKGTHVAMLHQDDLWLPGHLAALRSAIDRAPMAAMSVAASQFIDAKGHRVGQWTLPFPRGLCAGPAIAEKLIVQNTIAIPSPMIRRDAWLAVGGMDEALWYTADWDLYLKLALHGEVDVRPETTTGFRLHGSSLTMTGRHDGVSFARQHDIVLARHLPSLPVDARTRQEPLARASKMLNCTLASLSARNSADLPALFRALWNVGPGRMGQLLRETRIIERFLPRLRLGMAGGL